MKPPVRRSAYARLCYVADLIRKSEKIPNHQQIASNWECSYKTIMRDFDLLRDFFNYPLVYNKSTYSWELNGTPPNPVL